MLSLRQRRILCVERDAGTLHHRSEILALHGYHAESVLLAEADQAISQGAFALIIISAILNAEEQARIVDAAGGASRFLTLHGQTAPSALLATVSQLLDQRATRELVR